MARYVFSEKDQVSGGRVAGAKSLAEGTGLFSMTPEQRHAASVAGGKTQGLITGRQMVESGQLERIRNLPQTKAAQSEVGKRTGRAVGLKYGPLVDFSKIKTPESLSLGGINSSGRHVRHHVNKQRLNLACPLCVAAKENGESWWTSIFTSDDKRAWTGKPRSKNSRIKQ